MSDTLVLASRWSSAANRRREGLRAAHAQDAAALADLLTTYMRLKSSKGARVSELTLAHYQESALRFLAFTGPPEAPQRHLTTLEAEDFELWMLTLEREGLSPNSVKRHLYGVRNLMRALVWAGVVAQDPSAGVRPPADPSPAHARKGALPLEVYKTLLTLPALRHGEQALQARRDRLLLLLGGHAGLRAAEIVGLDVNDLDLALGQFRVRGKGQKVRLLPIGKALAGAMADWLTSRESLAISGSVRSDAVLLSLSGLNYGGRLSTDGARYIAEGYYKEAGLPPRLWGLHTLRRTAGTHLYRVTRDLHVVADILGHASVSTSAIYAKMDVDVRREAMERLDAFREE